MAIILNALFLAILCGVLDVSTGLDEHFDPRNVSLDHRACMDEYCDYVMLWKAKEEEIIIEVQVAITMGYVGLGFSDDGQMTGADIVLGWIDQEGQIQIKDCHGTGNQTPEIDDSQDYQLISGYKNDTHTVIRFSRPWDTCHGDFIITGDTIRVIWAYNSKPLNTFEENLPRHEHRGVRSLYLKEPKMKQMPSMEDSSIITWDLTVSDDMILPSDSDTMYWCKIFKRPKLIGKHHFIGYIPLIEDSQLSYVHHIVVYECHLDNSEYHMDHWVGQKGAQCRRENMPQSWSKCKNPILVWAVGSQGEMFPDHVGFPMSEEHGGADYFMIEIHYSNEKLDKGIKDNSGLRLFLTDHLREYDGSILSIGHETGPATMIIPPNSVWSIKGHCDPICTQEGISAAGIKVISAVLHAHLLGSAIKVQHIRNGYELKPIVQDDNYDFNYQQARMFRNETTILPGDQLITTCVYDSTVKKGVTLGGAATTNEMCKVYLHYYPKMTFNYCNSKPILSNLFEAFGIQIYEQEKNRKQYNIDRKDELKKLKVMKQGFDYQDINFAETLPGFTYIKSLKISHPPSQLNRSYYELLMDEETWKNEDILEALKKVTTMASRFQPVCKPIGMTLPKEREVGSYVPYTKEDLCGEKPKYSPHGDLNIISLPINEIDGRRVNEEYRIVNNNMEDHTQKNKEMENSSTVTDFSILLYAIMVLVQVCII